MIRQAGKMREFGKARKALAMALVTTVAAMATWLAWPAGALTATGGDPGAYDPATMVIALTGNPDALDDEPVAGKLGDALLIAYGDESQAAEAAARLAADDDVESAGVDSEVSAAEAVESVDDAASRPAAPEPAGSASDAEEGESAGDDGSGAAAGGDDPFALADEARKSAGAETDDEGANGPLVAVIDSGAPDGAGLEGAYSVIEGGETADESGHAARVIARIREMAPDARIVSIRVLDAQNRGTAAGVYAALCLAGELGCGIANLSLYAPASSSGAAAISAAVEQAAASGMAVVVAAGNDGEDAAAYVPASSPGAICVGAVDAAGALAGGSNFGDEVDLYALADSTSLAAAAATGWLAANSDLANPLGDLLAACGDGTFSAEALEAVDAESDGLDGDDADDSTVRAAAQAISGTVKTELRPAADRTSSAVPANEVSIKGGGELPLSQAVLQNNTMGVVKGAKTICSSSGKKSELGVFLPCKSSYYTSGSKAVSVSGSFSLRWDSWAVDKDGNVLDVVLDVSNVTVKSDDAKLKQSSHIELLDNTTADGNGNLWCRAVATWNSSVANTGNVRVGVGMDVKMHFYRHGTTTETSSHFVMSVQDLDRPDRTKGTSESWTGGYVESFQLLSGFGGTVWLQGDIAQSEWPSGAGWTSGASAVSVTAGSGLLRATEKGRDEAADYPQTYRTGGAIRTAGSAAASFRWQGSICGTAILVSYDPISIRDKNSAGTSSAAGQGIVSKTVDDDGMPTSADNSRTSSSWRSTEVLWKGNATYRISAKPGYRVTKVQVIAYAGGREAGNGKTCAYTSGSQLSSLTFNSTSAASTTGSIWKTVQDYDIIVTTARVEPAAISLKVGKSVESAGYGHDLSGFTFALYSDEACTKPVVDSSGNAIVATSDSSGNASFQGLPAIEYDSAKSYPQTLAYYVKEVEGSAERIAYDSSVKKVEVSLTYDSGKGVLSAAQAAAPAFTNTFAPKGGVKVSKVDADTGAALAGATFAVYPGTYPTAAAAMASGSPAATMRSDSAGLASTSATALPAPGDYTVVETSAPLWHEATDEVRTFSLTPDLGDAAIVDLTQEPFENEPAGIALPLTGGPGTGIAVSVALIVLAGLLAAVPPIRRRVAGLLRPQSGMAAW